MWTFSPFCTLGASCCRTPLLLVSALVSRANFPQPGARRRQERQVRLGPEGPRTFTPRVTVSPPHPSLLRTRESLSHPRHQSSLLREAQDALKPGQQWTFPLGFHLIPITALWCREGRSRWQHCFTNRETKGRVSRQLKSLELRLLHSGPRLFCQIIPGNRDVSLNVWLRLFASPMSSDPS